MILYISSFLCYRFTIEAVILFTFLLKIIINNMKLKKMPVCLSRQEQLGSTFLWIAPRLVTHMTIPPAAYFISELSPLFNEIFIRKMRGQL